MVTPWGKSDSKHVYAPGIVFYGTPSHGGVKVNKSQNEKIHPAYRNANGWYEEDCEILKVIFTFPELFLDQDFVKVCIGLKRWFADASLIVERDAQVTKT